MRPSVATHAMLTADTAAPAAAHGSGSTAAAPSTPKNTPIASNRAPSSQVAHYLLSRIALHDVAVAQRISDSTTLCAVLNGESGRVTSNMMGKPSAT